MPYRVKHSLKAAINWTIDDFNIHFDTRYKDKVDAVFLYPLEAPDEYLISNGKIIYSFNTSVSFSLAVNNIFNIQYEELARYRMPGRNWIVETHLQL